MGLHPKALAEGGSSAPVSVMLSSAQGCPALSHADFHTGAYLQSCRRALCPRRL